MHGLRGRTSPLAARIILACDALDALTSERPYARTLDTDEAMAELRRSAGSQFDPLVAASLEKVIRSGLAERVESRPAQPVG